MFVGDFQSKSIPVRKLFQYSGGSKRVHSTQLVSDLKLSCTDVTEI